MIIGREHVLAREKIRSPAGKQPLFANRVVNLEAVLFTELEIVLAMAGSRVHRAGTGVQGHVVTNNQQRFAVVKWMSQTLVLKRFTAGTCYDLIVVDAIATQGIFHQGFGEQQAFGPLFAFDLQ